MAGGSLLVWGWEALDGPSAAPFLPSPSYLYPDGKNQNPDLTELRKVEPHQQIHVSEVRPSAAPAVPARCPQPHSTLAQRPWAGALAWWLCDLG